MSQEELLYRAYLEYRKASSTDAELQRFLEVVKTANQEDDLIILTKHKCNINLDWVEAIEEGLVFIEKAIREERQFITSEGEVIEIEKVKSVSRETVEHLAKHSELITRVTENEDLTPDKLYTVEKLTDYAIYENRFLYMVLCYLRDFISIRYDKIVEKIIQHKITKLVIEKNIDTSLKALLDKMLKEQGINYCEIIEVYSTIKKEEKIYNMESIIKNSIVFPNMHLYSYSSQMGKFMNDVFGFSYTHKNEHDDSIDSLATFCQRLLVMPQNRAKAKIIQM